MFQTTVVEKIKTHILYSTTFFLKNCVIYVIMWNKNCRAGQATDNSIIQHVCISCWIPKATNIHSEYVIFIAFQL